MANGLAQFSFYAFKHLDNCIGLVMCGVTSIFGWASILGPSFKCSFILFFLYLIKPWTFYKPNIKPCGQML